VARPGGLGRGLGSLIPNERADEADTRPVLREVEVGLIEPNPHQPRAFFDEESLGELADSIKEIGVLQPILLRSAENGRYQLVAGERRWRAARRAGLLTVPAIVRVTDDMAAVEQALVENLHRQDLTALEEAAAYKQLIEEFGLTHDQVATRVGKSRSAVTNTLRLTQLPLPIQNLVADGRLSAGHARALLGTSDRAYQEQLARRAVAEGWSVRAIEDAVKGRTGGAAVDVDQLDDEEESAGRGRRLPNPADAAPKLRPPGLLELEELLADHLDTRVEVTMSGKKGRVNIEFADLDDLERIYRRMTEASVEQ
jgi:ParB family transcriptional regulator, chromosome partitioning protein